MTNLFNQSCKGIFILHFCERKYAGSLLKEMIEIKHVCTNHNLMVKSYRPFQK